MDDKTTVLNTISGKVLELPARYLSHPVFSNYLVQVASGTKSFDANKYKPKTAEEYRGLKTSKAIDSPSEVTVDSTEPVPSTDVDQNGVTNE